MGKRETNGKVGRCLELAIAFLNRKNTPSLGVKTRQTNDLHIHEHLVVLRLDPKADIGIEKLLCDELEPFPGQTTGVQPGFADELKSPRLVESIAGQRKNGDHGVVKQVVPPYRQTDMTLLPVRGQPLAHVQEPTALFLEKYV